MVMHAWNPSMWDIELQTSEAFSSRPTQATGDPGLHTPQASVCVCVCAWACTFMYAQQKPNSSIMLNPCFVVLSQFPDFCYNRCDNQLIDVLCLIEATKTHYTFPFKLEVAHTVCLYNSRPLDAEATSGNGSCFLCGDRGPK